MLRDSRGDGNKTCGIPAELKTHFTIISAVAVSPAAKNGVRSCTFGESYVFQHSGADVLSLLTWTAFRPTAVKMLRITNR